MIGRVIESYARRFGYGVVRDFTGHGIGTTFHSGLIVPHFDDPDVRSRCMEPGMTFTIEPMLTLGTIDYDIWPDGWTAVTKDRKRTAQFEHTRAGHRGRPRDPDPAVARITGPQARPSGPAPARAGPPSDAAGRRPRARNPAAPLPPASSAPGDPRRVPVHDLDRPRQRARRRSALEPAQPGAARRAPPAVPRPPAPPAASTSPNPVPGR